jgi:molybdenum cofactor biosynthesis enzyme MoaA
MGEIAIAVIEQGIDELILHLTDQCGAECRYCAEGGLNDAD